MPSAREASSIVWISSADLASSIVSGVSMRSSRNASRVLPHTNGMSGVDSHAANEVGSASHRASDSGAEIARFFGTISPNNVCRPDTSASANTARTTSTATVSAGGTYPTTGSTAVSTIDSSVKPRAIDAALIPS